MILLMLAEKPFGISNYLQRDTNDDTLHIFLHCHFARQTWALADLLWTAISAWRGETPEWITYVFSLLTVQDFEKFLVICWFIWWNRSRLDMENISSTPQETAIMANFFLAAYRESNVSHSLQHARHKNRLWSSPVAGTIKINFDRAVLQKGCEVGIEGVARDSSGALLAWFSCRFRRQVDSEIAEALAAQEAVDLAIHYGWRRILIEGDRLSLINKLNNSSLGQSYTRPLVQDIKLATSLALFSLLLM
ncbi:UNVERIFIED_CONTAM: hypothetical protein Sradi_2536500 [Sesamum radiatum]|uniref:RNase H type-1 domain-containing protein n=1 Tax=Sesamum radiatum TaxID=300843 RepID=A0AAW2SL25_SESRA